MRDRSEKLGSEDIKVLLRNLSLPATIGMMVNALYNIIDTIFIGRGVGTLGIAGLTIAFPIQMIMMAFNLLIGVGASASVSICLGKGDKERADHIAGNSYLVILVSGALITIVGLVFIEPILKLFGATNELLPYAREYISVIFLGSIFYGFAVSSNNLIRSEGNAKMAMFSMIIGTGLNIPLDYIFIFTFNLGIKGAAIATIISQFASFIFVFYYFYSGKSSLKIGLRHLKPDFKIISEIFAVGSAAFARQVSGSVVGIVLNNSIRIYGTSLDTAIYGTIYRIIMFISMPLFGVVQGMQPIVGFNYGAKKLARVKEAVVLSLKVTATIAFIGFIVSEAFPEPLMSLFNKNEDFVKNGVPILRIVVMMTPIIGVQIVGATLFQALGKALPALILSLLRQVILFIPLVIILPKFKGMMGIWISFPIADLGAMIITLVFMIHQMKRLNEGEKAME
ncbi:MATE family efflux transporter [Clostridium bovifaecis]|uniref:Multidrug export protein MepA n=1 Tax=Clostridium bovifaecis TaxID=2184719 RepID=A0A6I6EV30_9CLOT|nr:MATE family efflux transporter [Clostridium bovifaecis]